MCPQVGIVIGPGGRSLATNLTRVGFDSSMNFQMISQIIRPRKFLVTVWTSKFALSSMFSHVSLPIGFVAELQAAIIANKRLDSPVSSHVSLQL